MPSPELVIKRGSNSESYIFEIKAGGQPRSVVGKTVKFYIVNRLTRAIAFQTDLVQVAGAGNEHKVKLVTVANQLPQKGFYDGETHITDGSGYVEPYDEFPVTIEESAIDTVADKSFDNWLPTP